MLDKYLQRLSFGGQYFLASAIYVLLSLNIIVASSLGHINAEQDQCGNCLSGEVCVAVGESYECHCIGQDDEP
ncbi:MAG: hypothetical protein LBJ67_11675 [Planctomycetaceae bacterium]|jgi:hypothetical protein|nr:hypothetical protein [Planctomycetaceae bacterium]